MGWQLYENNVPGLYIDVDTTSAGFTGTPVYTVAVGGTDHHFELTGLPGRPGERRNVGWSAVDRLHPDLSPFPP
jgi:hypothetical protein